MALRGQASLYEDPQGRAAAEGSADPHVCDWLFRAILLDRNVLDYANAYFQLGPIERRIYEVAAKISLMSISRRVGCRSAIRTPFRISALRYGRLRLPIQSRIIGWSWWKLRTKRRKVQPLPRHAAGVRQSRHGWSSQSELEHLPNP